MGIVYPKGLNPSGSTGPVPARRSGGGNVGFDSFTKVLMHMDGANNGTTFTDVSGKSWTAVDNAVTSTAQAKFGATSASFDGTLDVIHTPNHADFTFDTGDFTIDFWVYTAANGQWCGQWDVSSAWQCGNGPGTIQFFWQVSGSTKALYTTTAFNVPASTWTHVAFVRNGANFYIFSGGISKALTVSTAIAGNSLGQVAANMCIGNRRMTDGSFNGYIDEFRLSKGIARWTADFTVPASAYT
jgi:hypothetical protein